MGVFSFDPDELEGIAPMDAQKQYLQKFGFAPPPLPSGYSHITPAMRAPSPQQARNGMQVNGHSNASRRATPPPTPPPDNGQVNGFGHTSHSGEQVTMLVARKAPKNKKRVQPTFMGSLGAGGPSTQSSFRTAMSGQHRIPSANVPISDHFEDNNTSSNINIKLPPPPLQSFGHPQPTAQSNSAFIRPAEPSDPFMDVDSGYLADNTMDMDVPISTFESRGKRRQSEVDDSGRSIKPRTLGGDRVRESTSNNDIREIRSRLEAVRFVGEASGSNMLLEAPALKTLICCNVDDSTANSSTQSGDVLEVRNSEDGSK